MKHRIITLITPEKRSNIHHFYAERRSAILDAIEATLRDGAGKLYLRYADGADEWVDTADVLLYRIDTWLLREQRGTMDTGLVYLVGGKRYAIKAAMQDVDFDETM